MLEAVGKLGDHRRPGLGNAQEQRHRDHQPQHEVHERPGTQDDDLFPSRLPRERPGVAGILVLPLHSAVAANRESAQGIKGFPFLPAPQRGAHADGKFVHLYPQQLGGKEMPELMDGNHHAKQQDRQQNIQKSYQNVFTSQLVQPPHGRRGLPQKCPPNRGRPPQAPAPAPALPAGQCPENRFCPPKTGPPPPRWRH